ncbi:hypothetical protein ES332_A07G058500v1 [Gossypium tomentosum]|uniref:Uncharacterized protein n=1 Tax=Gossypium tomentosum TaxID=34277 RepID=A0A5D2PRZ1_GOSTO|nr:hypothetical protein ES332_A07G058500v1 [Gossypium tomentosum]
MPKKKIYFHLFLPHLFVLSKPKRHPNGFDGFRDRRRPPTAVRRQETGGGGVNDGGEKHTFTVLVRWWQTSGGVRADMAKA